MWFGFALTFAVCSSLGTIIAKRVMREMDERAYLFFSGIFTTPFLLGIILYFYEIPQVDKIFFASLAGATTIGVAGALLAYRAIKIAEISLVSPISAFNPVFTAVISYITLGEKIGLKGLVGILLVVVGAYLLQISNIKEGWLVPLGGLLENKGVRYSLIAYFIWSITPIFEKTAIRHTTPQVPPFASLVSMVMSMFVYGYLVAKSSKGVKKLVRRYWRYFILVGVVGGVGQAAAFVTFSLTNLGYATAVFKLSMILTVILGWLFFKEKKIKDRLLGSVVMLIGVYLLIS